MTDAGGRISAAHAFKGTVHMFEQAGSDVERRQANRSGAPGPIVRREI